MRDEFLDLRLLFVAELFLPDLVRAEHFHEPRNVLNQNVIAGYHDLLLCIAARLSLSRRRLRSASDSVYAVSSLPAALR